MNSGQAVKLTVKKQRGGGFCRSFPSDGLCGVGLFAYLRGHQFCIELCGFLPFVVVTGLL